MDPSLPVFTQTPAQTLWESYLRQVNDLCGLLDMRQKADIQMELKAHLLESYIQLEEGDELTRLQTAIARLGQPEEFVPSWVEERLLEGSQPGSVARNLLHLLRVNAFKSIRQFILSMLIGFGYLIAFYMFLVVIMKLIFPDHVGLYVSDTGWLVIGYVDSIHFKELLGFWLIPLGLAGSILLSWLLNNLLRRKGTAVKS